MADGMDKPPASPPAPGPPAQATPKPRRRRLRKIALWTLGSLAVLLLSARVLACTAVGRDLARKQIVKQLGKMMNGEVTLARIDGDLLGTMHLRGFSVRGAAGDIITVDDLEVSWGTLAAVKAAFGTVRFRAVTIRGARVVLRQDAAGQLELATLMKPRPPAKGTTVIDRLQVVGAELRLERAGQPPVTVRGIDLGASLKSTPTALDARDLALGLASGHSRLGLTGEVHSKPGRLRGRAALAVDLRAADLAALWPASPIRRDLTARAELGGPGVRPGTVTLEVVVGQGGGGVRVQSRLPGRLRSNMPLGADISIVGLDLGGLLGQPALSELGRLSGEISAHGRGPEPGAPLTAATGRVTATLRGLGFQAIKVGRIGLDAELRGGRVLLHELAVLARGAALRLSGEVDPLSRDHRLRLLASVDDLALVVPASVGLSGPAEVDAVLDGRGLDPATRAVVRAAGIAMQDKGLAARRLEADARLRGVIEDPLLDALVHLDDVTTPVRPVETQDVRLRSWFARPHAWWSFDRIVTRSGGRVAVRQRGEGSFSVGPGLRADSLSLDVLSGRVSVSAGLDWFMRGTARVSAALDLGEVIAFLPGGMTRGIPLRAGRVTVTDLAVSSLLPSGGHPLPGLRVTGKLGLVDGRLRGLQPTLGGSVTLEHPGRRKVGAELTLDGRRWITVRDLTAPDRLLLGDLRVLQRRLLPAELGGSISIERGPLGALAALLPALRHRRLVATEVEGHIDLAATAGAPELRLSLDAHGLSSPNRPAFDAGVRLRVPDYDRAPGAPEPTEVVRRMAFSAWVGRGDRRLGLDLSARVAVADVLAYVLKPRADRLERLLTAELAGALRIDTVNVVRLLRSFGAQPPSWASATATGKLELSGSARLPIAKGRLSIGRLFPGLLGRLYIPIDIDLTPRQLAVTSDAAGLLGWPFLGAYARRDGGTLVGALLERSGPPVELSLRLEQTRRGYLVGAIKVDPARLGGGRSPLAALVFPGTFKASDFDVEAVRGFVPSLRELRGTVNGSLFVNALLPLPALTGRLAVTDGAFALRGYPRRYDRIKVTLDLAGQDVVIKEASLYAGDGKLGLTGRVTGMRQVTGTLLLSEFPLLGPAGPSAWINGQLDLSGKYQDGALRGNARFVDAQLRIPPESTRDVQSLDPLDDVTVVGEPKRAAGLLESLVAELTLATDRLWIVRGQDTRLAIMADLKATTRPGRPPQLAGQIRALAGDVELLGKSFRVERGVISLDANQKVIDPELDLRFAHSDVESDTIVYIDVSGRLSAPRIRFRADPPLTEAQVLGLLLHGDPGWETNEAQGAARRRAERTVATLAQAFLRDRVPGARAIKFVPVIEPEEERQSGSTGGRYGVRIPITDTFVFETTVRTGTIEDENTYEGRLQLRLRRRLNVQVSAGDAAKGGVDLVWTFRY